MFDQFKKFLGHYAGEVLGVANALTTVLDGLALKPSDAAIVKEVIAKLEMASESITGSVNKIKPVKIAKKDIEEAVAAVLPNVLNDVVTKAVTEALAKEVAKDA